MEKKAALIFLSKREENMIEKLKKETLTPHRAQIIRTALYEYYRKTFNK